MANLAPENLPALVADLEAQDHDLLTSDEKAKEKPRVSRLHDRCKKGGRGGRRNL